MAHFYLRVETETGAVAETYPDFEPATLNQNVRQAISHALDRALLAEVQGSAIPRLGRVCDYYPEGSVNGLADPQAIADWYDPDMARQLLIDAGYNLDAGEGPTIYLDAPTSQFGSEKEVAEVAAVMLEEVGFKVELNILNSSAFSEQITSGGNNRDMMMTTLGCSPRWCRASTCAAGFRPTTTSASRNGTLWASRSLRRLTRPLGLNCGASGGTTTWIMPRPSPSTRSTASWPTTPPSSNSRRARMARSPSAI